MPKLGQEKETRVYFRERANEQLSLTPAASEKDKKYERVFVIKFKFTNKLENAFGRMASLFAELQEKPKELVLNIDKEVIQVCSWLLRLFLYPIGRKGEQKMACGLRSCF